MICSGLNRFPLAIADSFVPGRLSQSTRSKASRSRQAFSSVSTAAAGTLLRHDMKPDRTGWTVCDAIEARPVCLGGVALVGLSFEQANELVDVLNRQDIEIERQARQLVVEAMQPRSRGL